MKALFVICFIVTSLSAQADVTKVQAKKKAISFAQNDQVHFYGGEAEIKDVTTLLETKIQIDFFKMIAHSTCDSANMKNEPICIIVEKEGFFDFEEYFVFKIDFLDCESRANFIGVEIKTGKARYLFSLGI